MRQCILRPLCIFIHAFLRDLLFSHNCLQNHCFAFCQNGLGMLCGQHGCQRCRKGDPWHQKWTNLAPKWSSLATTWLPLGRLLANMAAQMCQVGHYLVPSSSVLVNMAAKGAEKKLFGTQNGPKTVILGGGFAYYAFICSKSQT